MKVCSLICILLLSAAAVLNAQQISHSALSFAPAQGNEHFIGSGSQIWQAVCELPGISGGFIQPLPKTNSETDSALYISGVLYPKPASEQLKYRFNISDEQKLKADIFTAQGNYIETHWLHASGHLPVTNLNNGIYFLRIRTSDSKKNGIFKFSIAK